MKAIGIIPARYASTRFPGKPLVHIGGKPMLQHVYERVVESRLFDTVAVATDDVRIAEACTAFGAQFIYTSPDHPSGTDRCAEAIRKLNPTADVVVNIQGDEPFIATEPLKTLLQLFENPAVRIGTLVQKINNEEELRSPNNVRVAVNLKGEALYFSRSVIPYIRNAEPVQWLEAYPFLKHVGIYAFRPDVLQTLVMLPVSPLESTEMLEQLRWLDNGYRVHVAETQYRSISVDTSEDLEKAESFFQAMKGAGRVVTL